MMLNMNIYIIHHNTIYICINRYYISSLYFGPIFSTKQPETREQKSPQIPNGCTSEYGAIRAMAPSAQKCRRAMFNQFAKMKL